MEAYETNAGTHATCRRLASHCHGPHRETLNLITRKNESGDDDLRVMRSTCLCDYRADLWTFCPSKT